MRPAGRSMSSLPSSSDIYEIDPQRDREQALTSGLTENTE